MRTCLLRYICALLTLHAAALCARELNDEFQVAITRSDRAWLTYAQVVNAFDSATVGYSFGEIRVLHSSKSRLRVSLVPRSGYTATYAGQSASGYDSELSRQLETDEFFAREGDSLQFFREVSVWLPCIGEYTSDPFSPSDMAAVAAEPRLRYFGLGGVAVPYTLPTLATIFCSNLPVRTILRDKISLHTCTYYIKLTSSIDTDRCVL